jgi:long-chain acyl-CoA synthetase
VEPGSPVVSTSLASLLVEHPFADDEPLLHTASRSMTAGEARAASRELAERLAAHVGPGRAVAVRLPDGPEVVIAMTAIWLARAVFVPVNVRSPAAELDRVLDACRPAALLDSEGLHRLEGARTYEPGVAFVTWTSGTTGAPKAILHTHEAYLELIDRVLGPLRGGPPRGDRPPPPNLVPVPLSLNAGIYNVLFGLRAGAALVILERFGTAVFAELVRRFGIRSTVLPPAAIAMLADDPQVTDLTPLRYVRSITAPLSPLQARRFTSKFGVTVLNGYGQAEIGEVIGWTAADARAHPEKLGAAGRPHPGVAIKVVDDRGRPVATDEVGRLLVKPPSMATGYATGEDLADRLDPEGYVDTGDLARVDADGFVWIEGRADDVINRGGNKVVPEQVEEVLRLSPAVTDAAVVGIPDPRLGEVPVAFLTGTPVPPAELEALCRAHLLPYKVPVAYHFVDDLPRNAVGKVLRRELRRRMPPASAGSER